MQMIMGNLEPRKSHKGQLLKKYYPDDKPGPVSLEGFIDAKVLVEGLRKAGINLTREKFVQALESLHGYDLGLGPEYNLQFNSTNHNQGPYSFFLNHLTFTHLRLLRCSESR